MKIAEIYMSIGLFLLISTRCYAAMAPDSGHSFFASRHHQKTIRWEDLCLTYRDRDPRAYRIDKALDKYDLYDRGGQRPPSRMSPPEDDSSEPEFVVEPKQPLPSQIRPRVSPRTLLPVQTEVPPRPPRPASVDHLMALSEPEPRGLPPSGLRKSFIHQRANTFLELGTELFHYTYREPGVMRQKNFMYGIHGLLTHRLREHNAWGDWKRNMMIFNMFRFEGRFAYGELDYESESSGTDDGRPNYSAEFRVLMGCDFPVRPSMRLTPFLGVGFRYLLDDGGGRLTSTGAVSYDRESNYWYIPAGVESLVQLNKHWSLEWSAEYDYLLYGLQKSHIGDAGAYIHHYAGYPDVENKQDAGTGLRGSIRAVYHQPRIDIAIEPFIRYWAIEKSKTKTVSHNGVTEVWWEPKNNTTEFGLKFGLRY